MIDSIVSVNWLKDHLNDSNLVLLDASQPSDINSPVIKGAKVFDIKNDFSNTKSKYPNTLPSIDQFESESRRLGINNTSIIIVYDNKGIYFSPRVWWMFKAMGHNNVFVLDGGLPEWKKQGFNLDNNNITISNRGNFKANYQPEMFNDYGFISRNIESNEALVLDARSTGRFNGTTPEPRAGLKGGNIPNSISLPFTDVLSDGKFKSKAELTVLFEAYKAEEKPLVFTCGSGITACITLLACNSILPNDKSVYDGSWTEWALKQS